VSELGAVAVGQAALHLGAGRRTKDDSIDHSVGIVCLLKPGDRVAEGEPLAEIHAATDADADEAARELRAAYAFADEPPPSRSVVLEVIA
jgi:thymidine phosphorylase